jgi:two-component system response regulator
MDLRNPKPFLPKNPSPGSMRDRKYLLVADDNEGDRILLKKAMEENQIQEEFRFVKGGAELVDLLNQGTGILFPSGFSLPALIFLDLYMSPMDGHQVLKIIKSDTRFKKIPVLILTASSNLDDVTRSYNDGANSFLTKPLEYENLVKLIGLVKRYWLQETHLPV